MAVSVASALQSAAPYVQGYELALRSEVGGSSDSQGLGAALVHHSPGTRA